MLNPFMSDVHEAQSTVHVQLKPRKQRNQQHKEKAGDGWMNRQDLSIRYTIYYMLHNSHSVSPSSLSFSLSFSSLSLNPYLLPSLTIKFFCLFPCYLYEFYVYFVSLFHVHLCLSVKFTFLFCSVN